MINIGICSDCEKLVKSSWISARIHQFSVVELIPRSATGSIMRYEMCGTGSMQI